MCCCCPPAIKALFCLWIRNGFSKDCVAGALTFFPPDPSMYRFRRVGKDGRELPDQLDDDENGDDDDEENGEVIEYESELAESSSRQESERQPLELEVKSGSSGVSASGSAEDGERKKKKKKKRGEGEQRQKRETSSDRSKSSKSKSKSNQSAASALSERHKNLLRNASRRLKRDKRDHDNGVRYELLVDPTLIPSRFHPYMAQMEALKLYNKKARSYIATVVYRADSSIADTNTETVRTILYSHGNATDLGAMSLMQCYMARGLNCNVVMYDYSGYGESGGTPLEKNTYTDIETVYNYVLENIANKIPENIIMYGQSVGSGPSCYVCSKRPAGGLILHSPFMSGMRVLTPSRALACLDIFPNIDRIKKVNCPVMIIHGMQDEEVDMAHGVALHNAVKKDYKRDPWWVPDRGHNDICDGNRNMNEYIRRLRDFLDSLDDDYDLVAEAPNGNNQRVGSS